MAKEIKFPLDIYNYHFTSWRNASIQLGYSGNDTRSLKNRYEKMKDTHSLEEIFIPKGTGSLFPLDVNGYHFVSWNDTDKQLGYKSMKNRYDKMKDTHTLEEIFVPKGTGSLFPLDVNGYHFLHFEDAGLQLGYRNGNPIKSRYDKMKDTHTLEEIFVPKGTGSLFPLDVNGYHFVSWLNTSKQLGYKDGTSMKNRYEKMKDTHSLEEIFVPKGTGSLFPLDVNGYHFVSWDDASRKLNQSSGQSMKNRYEKMKDNHSLEEIFVYSVHIKRHYKKSSLFPLDVNGYHFLHWNDAGRQLGYDSGSYIKEKYNRMKDTHSLEEIFVPKGTGSLFPLDVNGYHFVSWEDVGRQLGYCNGNTIKSHYEKKKDTHSLEEIFIPKVVKETLFPLDVNGYHFVSWDDASNQLNICANTLRIRYQKCYTLMEVFGFSVHIIDTRGTQIDTKITCHTKVSDNLYKCKNKVTGLFELHTYDELNDMWRKYKGVKIVKE